jgi:hypothetical protein
MGSIAPACAFIAACTPEVVEKNVEVDKLVEFTPTPLPPQAINLVAMYHLPFAESRSGGYIQ